MSTSIITLKGRAATAAETPPFINYKIDIVDSAGTAQSFKINGTDVKSQKVDTSDGAVSGIITPVDAQGNILSGPFTKVAFSFVAPVTGGGGGSGLIVADGVEVTAG